MPVPRAVLATAIVLLAPLTAGTPAAAATGVDRVEVAGPAVPAPEWTALFDRRAGWTGADGIYSIPLSGDERPGAAGLDAPTFFTFSDTFLGQVDAAGGRVSGSTLVNNTNALLAGSLPDPGRIQFSWRRGGPAPAAQVVPRPQGTERTWFWPNDGVVVDGRLYLYSLRMRDGGSGVFAFETDGVSLLAARADDRPAFSRYAQTDTSLYLPAADSGARAAQGETTYGMAVLPNTTTAGVPAPDGYLYIYGLRNDPFNKKLLVARVLPRQIADFAAYRFWDGASWNPDITTAEPVSSRMSSEVSVSPLADGRYILVFLLDALSDQVAIRYANSPVGPWSNYTVVYTAPEDDLTPNTYTYNAKAHPHLSEPDRLLISYNVNTFDFLESFRNADIYRPRFIWLPLG